MPNLRLCKSEDEAHRHPNLWRHWSRYWRSRCGKGRNSGSSHWKRRHAWRRNCHRRNRRICGRLSHRGLERRGYGFQIPEWKSIVKELREICQDNRVGCHLDLGHAYANFPFSMKNTLDEWLAAGSELINGVHIHQFLKKRSQDAPYPQGHAHISGRMAGFPSLEPLFRFWQMTEHHFPLILEIRKGEIDPMPSIRRMLATLPF